MHPYCINSVPSPFQFSIHAMDVVLLSTPTHLDLADRFHRQQFTAAVEEESKPKGSLWSCPENEKQISVDPQSLMSPGIVTASKIPPPSPRAKPPPISLPSSPRFGLWSVKKKSSHASPRRINGKSLRKCSTVHPHHPATGNGIQLRRSKSCAEGRSSGVDELDIWFKNPEEFSEPAAKSSSSSSPRIESPGVEEKKKKTKNKDANVRNSNEEEEEFKCGALCLYLPGFSGGGGKAKPVRERKTSTTPPSAAGNIISRTVSLEKFECGSWASSAIVNGDEEVEESTRFYYDLPMELIKTGADETHSPVAAAFVFDKDRKAGVLKSGSTTPNRKSHESSAWQVRFSRSSSASAPSSPAACITPRLRKARAEFNAFLEAEARTA